MRSCFILWWAKRVPSPFTSRNDLDIREKCEKEGRGVGKSDRSKTLNEDRRQNVPVVPGSDRCQLISWGLSRMKWTMVDIKAQTRRVLLTAITYLPSTPRLELLGSDYQSLSCLPINKDPVCLPEVDTPFPLIRVASSYPECIPHYTRHWVSQHVQVIRCSKSKLHEYILVFSRVSRRVPKGFQRFFQGSPRFISYHNHNMLAYCHVHLLKRADIVILLFRPVDNIFLADVLISTH